MQPNWEQGCTLAEGGVPSLGCLTQVVQPVISVAFAFAAAVAVIFLILGAIKFVFSRGDPKALQSAKGTMTWAIIGLVLILLVFVILGVMADLLNLPAIFTNFSFYQG